jgi:4-hydroxy-3-polyprenylbenzoate decarboxylase
MAFDDLSQFLQAAADAGELERITVELNADQEIAAVTQEICRAFRDRSPVILCEHVTGSSIPVVTNLFGSTSRFLRTLGCSQIDEAVTRLESVLLPGSGLGDASGTGRPVAGSLERQRLLPRVIRRAACQQVIKLAREIDLAQLPLLRSWPEESHAVMNAGIALARLPHGAIEAGRLSAAVLDRGRCLLIPQSPEQAGRLFEPETFAAAPQQQLPVALTVGGDPLLGYVAGLPFPVDPWTLAGFLRNENVNLVRARSVELDVPAEAEIVLEGYLELLPEPVTVRIANSQGLVQPVLSRVVMQVTAITHRANPLLPAHILNYEFQEDCVTNSLTERLLLSLARFLNREITDLHFPVASASRGMVYVGLASSEPNRVQQALQTVAGLPLLRTARLIAGFPARTPLRNPEAIVRDLSLCRAVPQPASLSAALQGPCFLDATGLTSPGTVGHHRGQASELVLSQIADRLGAREIPPARQLAGI